MANRFVKVELLIDPVANETYQRLAKAAGKSVAELMADDLEYLAEGWALCLQEPRIAAEAARLKNGRGHIPGQDAER